MDLTALQEVTFPEWLPFSGNATAEGDDVILQGAGGGAFRMRASDVVVGEGVVLVRNQSNASILEHPKVRALSKIEIESAAPGGCVRQDDCPEGCCACIGLVRVCCGHGGTRGVCLGVWGCPG